MKLMVPRYGAHTQVLGLPRKAITITNSERGTAACPLRWLFRHGDGLVPTTRSAPLAMGSAVHSVVEDTHRWWMVNDSEYPGDGTRCVWCDSGCDLCDHTGLGPVSRHGKDWADFALSDLSGEYTHEQSQEDLDRLFRIVTGWWERWGKSPPEGFRVIAPELRMAVPILNPDGKPYRTRTWIVPDGDGWRLAGTGEAHLDGAKSVRWPWFQCLTVDALFQCRDTGTLWVYEFKTARSPERRLSSVSIDPQVAGYVWAVQSVVNRGLIPGVDPGTRVAGWHYDVASNGKQVDPEPLKPVKVKDLDENGEPYKVKGRWAYVLDSEGNPVERSPGLSRRVGTCPSWRYREIIHQMGLDPSEYQETLMDLMMSVDPRLYVRDEGTSGPEVGARYGRELFAVGTQIASMRRKAAELRVPQDRDLHFPRQPVCLSSGYGCAYRGPCLQDGDLVRRDFTRAESVRWVSETSETSHTEPQEDLGW